MYPRPLLALIWSTTTRPTTGRAPAPARAAGRTATGGRAEPAPGAAAGQRGPVPRDGPVVEDRPSTVPAAVPRRRAGDPAPGRPGEGRDRRGRTAPAGRGSRGPRRSWGRPGAAVRGGPGREALRSHGCLPGHSGRPGRAGPASPVGTLVGASSWSRCASGRVTRRGAHPLEVDVTRRRQVCGPLHAAQRNRACGARSNTRPHGGHSSEPFRPPSPRLLTGRQSGAEGRDCARGGRGLA